MNESKLLQIRIKLEALITKREGMIANNRQHYECEPYSEKDFSEVENKISVLLKEFEEPEKRLVRIVSNGEWRYKIVDARSSEVLYSKGSKVIELLHVCRVNDWEVVE